MASMDPPRSWTAVVAAVAVHPELWATAVGQVFRLSPTGWWRRPPFVPKPDPAYVQFRIATQNGGGATADTSAAPAADDVVEYLAWCRSLASR